MTEKLEFKNSFSLIFGLLCLGVVYIHSSWIGGFEVYSLDLENQTLTRIISLLLLMIVPSFFIMWGYLSSKYFYSDEGPMEFFRRKLIQFYPIYLLSFIINFSYRSEYMVTIPIWKLFLNFLGIYYASGMRGGGNIYIVVIFVLLTVTLFKKIKYGKYAIMGFALFCMAITKVLPHESEFCYVQYFGYYTAFFMGVSLSHFGIFDGKCDVNIYERILISLLALVGILTPLLNLFNIRFVELQYNPNSYEQLVLCCLVIYGVNLMLKTSKLPERDWALIKFLHVIGNNAYGHFIIHTHVIALFVYINTIIHFNKLVMQLVVIMSTSYISVFWVMRLYQAFEMRIKKIDRIS